MKAFQLIPQIGKFLAHILQHLGARRTAHGIRMFPTSHGVIVAAGADKSNGSGGSSARPFRLDHLDGSEGSFVLATRNGGTCARCGRPAKFRTYCSNCRTAIWELQRQYLASATNILARSGPLGPEWRQLEAWCYSVSLPDTEALQATETIRNDWLRRYAAFASADGMVTDEELATFRHARDAMHVSAVVAQPLDAQLQRERMLGKVRQGQLPTVPALAVHLPSDEICHYSAPATRWRPLKSGSVPVEGILAVTNRKIRFSAPRYGGEVALGKVHRPVVTSTTSFLLEGTTGSMSGQYTVSDAEWAATIIETALRIDRRTLVVGGGGENGSRVIPQHVKTAVWQRDGGRCVQCGEQTYLEFDHVIPWSKGGASTVENLQVLCRRCNLTKSNRI